MKKTALLLALLQAAPAFAQTTTKPNVSNMLSQCAPNAPVVGNGAGAAPICDARGALGTAAFVNTGTSGGTLGLLNAANTWSATQTFAAISATAISGSPTITLTNATGLPISTGVSGLGAGVAGTLAVGINTTNGFPVYNASTWTPVITTTGTVGTPAYATQVGSYEAIGRQVNVRFSIALSGWTGSPTGTVNISGLPFTSANVANDLGVCHFATYVVAGLLASNILTAQINPNATTLPLGQVSSTVTSAVTAAQVGTTPTLIGWCQYHI